MASFVIIGCREAPRRITNETEDSNEPPELHFAASKNMEENRRRRGEGTEGGWKEDAEWGACVQ